MNLEQAKGQGWLDENGEVTVYGEKLKDGFRGDAKSYIIYHVQQYDKIPLKFTCKTKSPAIAYRYAPAEVKKRLIKPEDLKPKIKTLISDELAKYKEARKRDFESQEIEPATWVKIQQVIPVLEEYFGDEFPEIFDEDDFKSKKLAAFDDWFRETRKGQTAFNVYKYLSAFVGYLHEKGVIRKKPKIKDPRAKAERQKRKKKKGRILSKDEIKSLITAAESERDMLIIESGYVLGFRIGDACGLKWPMLHLELDDPWVCFEGEDKADTFSKNPIPISFAKKLIAWRDGQIEAGIESEWVFPQERNHAKPISTGQVHFKQIRLKAKVTHGTYHTLRHTRLTLDFGNPAIPDSHVMIMRRVSYKVAVEHYIHPTSENRKAMRELSEAL